MDVWQHLHQGLEPGIQPDGVTFVSSLGDCQLLQPIRTLPDSGNRIASLILNQASFEVLDKIADILSDKLRRYNVDVVVAVPTLGMPLAEAVARRLGHSRLVPLGYSQKFWYDPELAVDISSITSSKLPKKLYIDPRMVPLIKGKRVAVVDDVISSGTSIRAVLQLLRKIGVEPVVIGVAMLQGDSWAELGLNIEAAFATPILPRVP